MKTSFHPSVWLMFTLLLTLSACSDDESATPNLPVTPQHPGQPKPPVTQPNPTFAPVARAGNDTTMYFPFSNYTLNGSASTDPDSNIVSYQWRLLAGPSSVDINYYSHASKASASGLVMLGNYEFELTVTDADILSSKDTVIVTIAETSCTAPTGEVILKDLSWNYSWIMEIDIFDFYSHLPANSQLFSIYIKRDSSDDWEPVVPLYHNPDYSMHTWDYGNGVLAIYPHHNMKDDTPDVKIEYCN